MRCEHDEDHRFNSHHEILRRMLQLRGELIARFFRAGFQPDLPT